MTDDWFTTEGARDTLRVVRKNDSWYVASTGTGDATKCVFTGDENLSRRSGVVTVTATVSRYTIGTNGRPDYIILTDMVEKNANSTERSTQEQFQQDSEVAGTDQPRTSNARSESTDQRSDSSPTGRTETSLDKIAQEKLAGEEFTLEQQDESLIAGAKKRAKRQGRDPAIDPRLQQDRDSEEE